MDRGRPASKQELLEALLDRGMVMVTLDARRPGVDVPAQFQNDPRLRLNLSYRFGLPLEVNPWGVRATLTFGGVPHVCKVPWNALYQLFSHATKDQYLFPADVPTDLVEAEEHEAPAPAPPSPKGRPRLSVVPGAGEELPAPAPAPASVAPVSVPPVEGEPGPEEPPPGGGPRRGHLRRIK